MYSETSPAAAARAEVLFESHQERIYVRTDRLFVGLMVVQWGAAILAAYLISPLAWAGMTSATHPHVLAAVLLGGAITVLPVWLGVTRPGAASTRHVIAVAQMLMSALLIHLTGGRIETHFHVFGSLAFLAFYRDVTVFAPATVVVAADHFLRSMFWPESAYGVTSAPWRWIEHAGWVCFEDLFLIISCRQSISEMRGIATHRAEIELAREHTEALVRERTAELAASEARFRSLCAASPIGIFETDLRGEVTYINERWGEIAGMAVDAALGSGWVDAVHPDDRETLAAHWEVALRDQTESSDEFRMRASDGSVRWVQGRSKPVRADDGAVVGHVGTVEDVTDRKAAEEEVRRSERRLALQYAAARILAESETLADAGTGILRTICAHAGWDAGLLWRMDDGRAALRCRASWHRDDEAIAAVVARTSAHALVPGIGFAGKVWATQTTVWTPNRGDAAELGGDVLPRDVVRAVLGVPILLGKEIVAVMEFYSGRQEPPGDDALEALATLANHVAQFIERKNIEAAHQEEARTAAALARVGQELISSLDAPVLLDRLCQVTTDVLGCAYSTTWIHDAAADVYVPLATAGLAAEHWDMLRAVRVPARAFAALRDELLQDGVVIVPATSGDHPAVSAMLQRHGAAYAVCIALRNGGELVGAQIAGFRPPVGAFRDDRIARGIGQLASVALTNARLVTELETASRLKSEFVSTMSHELRTPLNVVLGYLEMLQDEPEADERRILLQKVRQSSLALLDLVQATLDIDRIAAGHDVPQCESVQLDELCAEIDREILSSSRRAEVELRWRAPAATFATDRRKLQTILKNLVGNALKFTPAGEIAVGCEVGTSALTLSVRDTGIGIAHEDLAHIFEMFRQVDNSDSRRYGGTGLGLYIVDTLVTQLGGAIAVESELGAGSTFCVTLPSMRAKPASDDADPAATLTAVA